MFSLSQDFHRASSERNQRPVLLFTLTNSFGARMYSERHPSDEVMGLKNPPKADGEFLADGARAAGEGSLNLLEAGAKVLSFGTLRETLTPLRGELAASYGQEEPGSITVVLANQGSATVGPFARLEAVENLLGAKCELLIGYPGIAARDYLSRFSGRVDSYRLEAEKLSITVRA